MNVKLREMCDTVGLLDRNTLYSFRRAAIIETRRTMGTEVAKELAGHNQDSQTIYEYDDEPLEDLDLVNMRLDLEQMSRAELRAMFAQATLARAKIHPANSTTESVVERLRKEADLRAREDEEYRVSHVRCCRYSRVMLTQTATDHR